jgi:hypothetical protein
VRARASSTGISRCLCRFTTIKKKDTIPFYLYLILFHINLPRKKQKKKKWNHFCGTEKKKLLMKIVVWNNEENKKQKKISVRYVFLCVLFLFLMFLHMEDSGRVISGSFGWWSFGPMCVHCTVLHSKKQNTHIKSSI